MRDFIYRPSLSGLARRIDPRETEAWWSSGRVRDQNSEHNCTAHAVAGIVDHLRVRDRMLDNPDEAKPLAEDAKPWTSAKMLFNIARFHDPFPGENYEGSSIRGALKGFYFNGACSDEEATALTGSQWHMTRQILESARRIQLGAYYRVRPRLPDVHAALNEARLVLASADIHRGWTTQKGIIEFGGSVAENVGRHAFVLIGYTDEGFLVQNSWGRSWGEDGVALWKYDDWAANVVDQWVLRLAVPVKASPEIGHPQIAVQRGMHFGHAAFEEKSLYAATPPNRFDVLGHVASLSRGRFDRYGPYHVDRETLMETVRVIKGSTKYNHVLIHFMGLQRHEAATMAALRDAIPVFKKNGIYPFFVTVENDLSSAVHDLVETEIAGANQLSGMAESPEKDLWIEARLAGAPLRMVEEIQRSSMAVAFSDGTPRLGQGLEVLNYLFKELEHRYVAGGISYHLSAHGFGSLLLASLVQRSKHWRRKPVLSSVSLLSPMVPAEFVCTSIGEWLAHPHDLPLNRRARAEEIAIERLDVYHQCPEAFKSDRPILGYSGNWPQMWSRVLAIASGRDKRKYDVLPTGKVQYDDISKRSVMPLLALNGMGGALRGRQCVRFLPVKARHRDFDLTIEVLDKLLTGVMGQEPAHRFAAAYTDQTSLMRDWGDSHDGAAPHDW